jgi:hypothetical protein
VLRIVWTLPVRDGLPLHERDAGRAVAAVAPGRHDGRVTGAAGAEAFPFRGEVLWLTPEQGGRQAGPPVPRPAWPYYAVTAYVPPQAAGTGLASFVLRDFTPGTWPQLLKGAACWAATTQARRSRLAPWSRSPKDPALWPTSPCSPYPMTKSSVSRQVRLAPSAEYERLDVGRIAVWPTRRSRRSGCRRLPKPPRPHPATARPHRRTPRPDRTRAGIPAP